jgi:metal-responsive CopG/Arc/MetJ family transcriptional regulator
MSVSISLPEDLVAKIDEVTSDRSAFVSEAVRQHLREGTVSSKGSELARINELADELNREAEDVLEYQVFS